MSYKENLQKKSLPKFSKGLIFVGRTLPATAEEVRRQVSASTRQDIKGALQSKSKSSDISCFSCLQQVLETMHKTKTH